MRKSLEIKKEELDELQEKLNAKERVSVPAFYTDLLF